MVRTVAGLIMSLSLVGCATPEQTFIAGMAVGAVIVDQAQQPRTVIVQPNRLPVCYNQYIGRDQWHRPLYTRVCR